MNYLLARQDLATWNPQEIAVLCDYFNIHHDDSDDLLWLLAINIIDNASKRAEMPPSKAWDLYKEQLLTRFSKRNDH